LKVQGWVQGRAGQKARRTAFMNQGMPFRGRRAPVLWALSGSLVLAMLWAASTGAVLIPWKDLTASLVSKLGMASAGDISVAHEAVLWNLRIPRVLFAALIGATLAVCGAILQGLFRNPLADPGLIGVASGAAMGAVVVILLAERVAWMASPWALPVAAFGGAFLATAVIYRLATSGGYTSAATLLLGGVAINAFGGAVVGFCSFAANDTQLRSLTFWLLGSLGAANWKILAACAPFCLLTLLLGPRFARALNAFALGEAEAGHLGFDPQKIKKRLVFLVAMGVGACVAHAGMIGFVGLVTPHLVRLLIGPDHRWLLSGSALLGAILLVVSDAVSRVAVSPAELPLGIVTAAAGAPFFLWLLWQQRRRMLRL